MRCYETNILIFEEWLLLMCNLLNIFIHVNICVPYTLILLQYRGLYTSDSHNYTISTTRYRSLTSLYELTILKQSTSLSTPAILVGQDSRPYTDGGSDSAFITLLQTLGWQWEYDPDFDYRIYNLHISQHAPITWVDYLGNPTAVSNGATNSDQT